MMFSMKMLVCVFCLSVVCVGYVVVTCAGPCYVQTSTMDASELGCSEDTIGPGGAPCASIRNPFTSGTTVACGHTIISNQIGVGTSGNEASGYMSQGMVSRPCITFVGCEASSVYWDGNLPVLQHMVYDCNVTVRNPGSATHMSVEPTGAVCPLSSE
jgi:hypothetical protein